MVGAGHKDSAWFAWQPAEDKAARNSLQGGCLGLFQSVLAGVPAGHQLRASWRHSLTSLTLAGAGSHRLAVRAASLLPTFPSNIPWARDFGQSASAHFGTMDFLYQLLPLSPFERPDPRSIPSPSSLLIAAHPLRLRYSLPIMLARSCLRPARTLNGLRNAAVNVSKVGVPKYATSSKN
jgi:hypothetical protein